MKRILSMLVVFGIVSGLSANPPRQPQRVLYIGNAMTPRAKEFEDLFRQHFVSVEVAERQGFEPKAAAQADVIVLDWSQRDPDRNSPLGQRENWNKPTVLLGSAGHKLAGAWEVRGGSG